eukprot:TRINITY_DN6614_c0_g1_i1.p1 TRINITY_DN6614_c0_g1~~TRINITY_DN6614_c0_g1_i1.p1  ORF type:complete len:863 (+),score=182.74 TRINITY_DN6614_c0_g1_i1:37-2625(+)
MQRSASCPDKNREWALRVYLHTPREKTPPTASGSYSARRSRPTAVHPTQEIEFMNEQIHHLKISNSQLRDDKTKLQTRVYKLEADLKRMQRGVYPESRPQSAASVHSIGIERNYSSESASSKSQSKTPRKEIVDSKLIQVGDVQKKDSIAYELEMIHRKIASISKMLESKATNAKESIVKILSSIDDTLRKLLESKSRTYAEEVEKDDELKTTAEHLHSSTTSDTAPISPPSEKDSISNPNQFLVKKTAESFAMRHNRANPTLASAPLSPPPPLSGPRKNSFAQRHGSILLKQRNSISMVFQSSSTLQLPQSRRAISKRSMQIENYNKLVAFLVESKSRLNTVRFDTITWEEFQSWVQEHAEDEHESIVQELFYVLKSYRKVMDITTQISFCQTVEEVISQVTSGIEEILLAEKVQLYTISSPGELSLFQANSSDVSKSFSTSRGVLGHVAESGEMENLSDPVSHPHYDPEIDSPYPLVLRNLIAVPLIDRFNQVFAVIVAFNKATGDFAKEDEVIIQSLVDQASNNIQHFKLLLKTQREKQKNQSLLEVLKVVNSDSATLDSIIDKIIKVTYDVLNADRVSLFLVDNIAHQLLLKVSKDNLTIRIPIGVGIAGTVAATGLVVNIADAYKDSRFDPTLDKKTGYRTRTILCMPIKDSNDRPVAVIQALNKAHGIFTKEDEDMLAAFSAEAASVLQRKSLETAYLNLIGSTSGTDAESSLKDMIEEYTMNKRVLKNKSRNDFSFTRFSPSTLSISVEGLKDWDFDHFSYSEEELVDLIVSGFDSLGLLSQFRVEKTQLRKFVLTVRSHYQDNPYHNFIHAFSVFQSVYIMLTTTDIGQYITPLDVYAILISAICHDLDHPVRV